MSHVSHARTRCPGWTHKCQQDGSARERGPDTLMSGQTLFDDAEQTDIPWRTGTVTSNAQHGWGRGEYSQAQGSQVEMMCSYSDRSSCAMSASSSMSSRTHPTACTNTYRSQSSSSVSSSNGSLRSQLRAAGLIRAPPPDYWGLLVAICSSFVLATAGGLRRRWGQGVRRSRRANSS